MPMSVWQKKYAVANDHKTINGVLCWCTSAHLVGSNLLPRGEEKDSQYKFEDEKGNFVVAITHAPRLPKNAPICITLSPTPTPVKKFGLNAPVFGLIRRMSINGIERRI